MNPQGSAHAWLFIPSAILLGALHGLEPGLSKNGWTGLAHRTAASAMVAAMLGVPCRLRRGEE
jgi:nickel/cobalt transporter (NicO) family protein